MARSGTFRPPVESLWVERFAIGYTPLALVLWPYAIGHKLLGFSMRAVIQRVTRASVAVDGRIEGQIGAGLLVLLGVGKGDEERDVQYLVEKIATLRIFAGPQGKMNVPIGEAGGPVRSVSRFAVVGEPET